MKTKKEKKIIIEETKDLFEKSKRVFFVNLLRFDAAMQKLLREEIKKNSGILKIVKKTLLKLSNPKINWDLDIFKNPFGFVFDFNENIEMFKILSKYSKEYNLNILGGFYNNKFLNEREILEIGELPPKEVLFKKFIYTIRLPLYRFINVIKAPINKLNLFISNIRKINGR